MAQRDRSQGFAFAYVDIKKLLEQRHEFGKGDVTAAVPVETKAATVVNLNKDPQPAPAPKTPEAPADFVRERSQAVNQIKDNLDRLQSLHHKLHAMLEELNSLTGKKKS